MELPPVIKTHDDRDKLFRGKGHTGLSNLGNTCFMNTILQCLSKTYELTEFMLCADEEGDSDKRYLKELVRKGVRVTERGRTFDCTPLERMQKKLVMDYEKLLYAIYDVPEGSLLAPRTIHNDLCGNNPRSPSLSMVMGRAEFIGYSQKDAEEFYGFLMEQMHMGLSHNVNINISGTPVNTFDKMAVAAMESWKRYFSKEYSKILELFYGQEYSLLICPDCGFESGTYQPMNRIHLPIPPDMEKVSLDDCFQLYNEGETLDKDNAWRCEGCNKGVSAQKCISIWKKPRYMVLHLKRFKKNGTKNTAHVDFPLDNLNIDDYCIGYGANGLKYDLYAIANHSGDTGGGHYYAYCKDYDGVWREYNDRTVRVVGKGGSTIKNNLVTNKAYLLFYKRRY